VKPTRREFLRCGLALTALAPKAHVALAADPASPHRLWYTSEAKRWLEALPIGNGRVCGMVFGCGAKERIALTESTVWSGAPRIADVNPEGVTHLNEIRQLIALYPEDQISPEKTPELAKAARVTLERRIQQSNWEDTEWSRANLMIYYARLWDGEAAHRHLVGLIAKATDDNLLTYSRGGVAGAAQNIFAIDGNTAEPPVSRRCCCNRRARRFTFCRPFPSHGQRAASAVFALETDFRLTFSGGPTDLFRQRSQAIEVQAAMSVTEKIFCRFG